MRNKNETFRKSILRVSYFMLTLSLFETDLNQPSHLDQLD